MTGFNVEPILVLTVAIPLPIVIGLAWWFWDYQRTHVPNYKLDSLLLSAPSTTSDPPIIPSGLLSVAIPSRLLSAALHTGNAEILA